MQKRSMCAMFAAALAVALMLLGAAPALAHEGRKLGDLEMEVGWGTEPAYSGEVNSVQILLVHDGKPVVDLGDTLDVEVTFGDQTRRSRWNPSSRRVSSERPGDYRAWLIPDAGPVLVPLHRNDRRRGRRRDLHVRAEDVRRRAEPAVRRVPRATAFDR